MLNKLNTSTTTTRAMKGVFGILGSHPISSSRNVIICIFHFWETFIFQIWSKKLDMWNWDPRISRSLKLGSRDLTLFEIGILHGIPGLPFQGPTTACFFFGGKLTSLVSGSTAFVWLRWNSENGYQAMNFLLFLRFSLFEGIFLGYAVLLHA